MAKCPKCKTEVTKPEKTWKLKKVTMGMYLCPKCKKKFPSKATR